MVVPALLQNRAGKISRKLDGNCVKVDVIQGIIYYIMEYDSLSNVASLKLLNNETT